MRNAVLTRCADSPSHLRGNPITLRRCCEVFFVAIVLLASPSNLKGQVTENDQLTVSLTPGLAIEKTLAGGLRHQLTTELKSGDWIRIVVAQDDIDLTLVLVGPRGEKLREVAGLSSIDRQPVMSWIAEVDGAYGLDVFPMNPKARRGKYVVTLTEKRASTQRDHNLFAAETALASAEGLLATNVRENLPLARERFTEAEALFRITEEYWQLGLAMRREAFVLVLQNNVDAARRVQEAALELLQARYGSKSLRLVPALWDLADVHARSGRLPAAREVLERAHSIIKETTGSDSIQAGMANLRLTSLLQAQGDDSALDVCQNSIRILEQHYGKGSLEVVGAYTIAAGLFQQADNAAEAGRLYGVTLRALEESFGVDSPQTIGTLHALSRLRASERDFEAAVAYQERVIRIVERNFVPRSRDVINAHGGYGNFLLMLGRPKAARAEFDIALNLSTPGSDDAANSLTGIARTLVAQGDFVEARKKFDRVIEIVEGRYGKASPQALSAIFSRLQAYPAAEHYLEGVKSFAPVIDALRPVGGQALAEALARAADFDVDHNHMEEGSLKLDEAIKILEGLGEQHVLRAAELRLRRGEALIELRKADEGFSLIRKSIATYEAAYGANSPALLDSLGSLAGQLIFALNYDEAEEVLHRSLRIIDEKHLGQQVIAARLFGLMAGLMAARGKFDATVVAARRSLTIYEKRRQGGMDDGENFVRNTLAETLLLQSKLTEMRDVLDETLALGRMQPERPQSELRTTRVLMAALLMRQGDNERAAGFLRDLNAVADSFVQSGDIRAIVYLNYAATMAMQLDLIKEALAFSVAAAGLAESRLEPGHQLTGRILANQSLILLYAKDYEGAEKVAAKAAAMLDKPVAQHYARVFPLIVRGEALVKKGKLEEGRRVLEQAQNVIETEFGAQNAFAAKGANRLAWLRRKEGDVAISRTLFLRSAEISDQFVRNTLPLLSFAEQQGFLQLEMPEQLSGLFTTCREGDDLRKAYQSLFRWKGSLVESLRQQASIARLKNAGVHSSEIKQLADVKSDLAGWYAKFSLVPATEWKAKNDKLTEEKERLERTLERAIKSGDFADLFPSGLLSFEQLLKSDEAFVDIYVHDYQDLNDATEERYVGVVTGFKSGPRLVDLGSTKKINDAIQLWRDKVFDLKPTADDWNKLATMLWKPLADALPAGTLKVWVSPDADLARIPWQLLPATYPQSRTVLVTQTDSTREFTRLRQTKLPPRAARRSLVLLVGDVDFDAGKSVDSSQIEQNHFDRIDGTRTEIEVLKRLTGTSRRVQVLTNGDATKARVIEGLQQSDYAHLATHGYFAREAKAVISSSNVFRFASIFGLDTPITRNPLVESGIALAGANLIDSQTLEARGLLTAEEITTLDLSRCELVTLSACETGRGEEVTGQGVLGFRAAVMAAGSRSLLMSLWKVPDGATAQFMETFYTNLWLKKMNKATALLRAQEAVRDGGYPEPINWAGWVLVGEAW